MDADDISSHGRFERQVSFLQKRPECYVVGAQAVRIDPDGSPISPWRLPEGHFEIDGQYVQVQLFTLP
jgi:hypothetical protein